MAEMKSNTDYNFFKVTDRINSEEKRLYKLLRKNIENEETRERAEKIYLLIKEIKEHGDSLQYVTDALHGRFFKSRRIDMLYPGFFELGSRLTTELVRYPLIDTGHVLAMQQADISSIEYQNTKENREIANSMLEIMEKNLEKLIRR